MKTVDCYNRSKQTLAFFSSQSINIPPEQKL